MTYTTQTSSAIQLLLGESVGDSLLLSEDMNGFGGIHGGLTTALLVSAMSDLVPGGILQSVSAQFLRPTPHSFNVQRELVRTGRTSSVATAVAGTNRPSVTATATFSSPSHTSAPTYSQQAPSAPPPAECDLVEIPIEFVPIVQHIEIRAVSAALPFSGSAEPELIAWLRLSGDDQPPDVLRLILLMDALAPSIFAALTEFAVAPTVELVVHPHAALAHTTDPWILLRTRTQQAAVSGWHTETLEAWSPQGHQIAQAQQLRLLNP